METVNKIKTKCEKCGSTLCLKIKNENNETIKFFCVNCGFEFDNLLPDNYELKKMGGDIYDI